MDYQPMGQMPTPTMNPTPAPVMNQVPEPSHSNGIWLVVGAAVVIALGLWYFYSTKAPATGEPVTETPAAAIEQTQIPALTSGNTTANISADLNQIPDSSAALNADAAASAQAVQGF